MVTYATHITCTQSHEIRGANDMGEKLVFLMIFNFSSSMWNFFSPIVAHFGFIRCQSRTFTCGVSGGGERARDRRAKVPQGEISSKIVDNAGDIMTWRKMKRSFIMKHSISSFRQHQPLGMYRHLSSSDISCVGHASMSECVDFVHMSTIWSWDDNDVRWKRPMEGGKSGYMHGKSMIDFWHTSLALAP